MEKLQVHRGVLIMSVYSTCHGLHLAAAHAQEKWVNHFQCALELREGVKPSRSRIWSSQVTHRPGMTPGRGP